MSQSEFNRIVGKVTSVLGSPSECPVHKHPIWYDITGTKKVDNNFFTNPGFKWTFEIFEDTYNNRFFYSFGRASSSFFEIEVYRENDFREINGYKVAREIESIRKDFPSLARITWPAIVHDYYEKAREITKNAKSEIKEFLEKNRDKFIEALNYKMIGDQANASKVIDSVLATLPHSSSQHHDGYQTIKIEHSSGLLFRSGWLLEHTRIAYDYHSIFLKPFCFRETAAKLQEAIRERSHRPVVKSNCMEWFEKLFRTPYQLKKVTNDLKSLINFFNNLEEILYSDKDRSDFRKKEKNDRRNAARRKKYQEKSKELKIKKAYEKRLAKLQELRKEEESKVQSK
jgi:hypothetical protein